MKRIATSLLCTIVFLCPFSNAFAQASNLQKLLKGTYHLVGTEFCTYAPDFSGPPSFDPIGSETNLALNIKGKIKYDGVANAVYTATAEARNVDFPNNTIITTSYTCNFGYVVELDRNFTLNGYCNGISSNGDDWFIPGFQIQGTMGPGKKPNLLFLSVTDANVQDYYVSGVPVLKRVCFLMETERRSNCQGEKCIGRPR